MKNEIEKIKCRTDSHRTWHAIQIVHEINFAFHDHEIYSSSAFRCFFEALVHYISCLFRLSAPNEENSSVLLRCQSFQCGQKYCCHLSSPSFSSISSMSDCEDIQIGPFAPFVLHLVLSQTKKANDKFNDRFQVIFHFATQFDVFSTFSSTPAFSLPFRIIIATQTQEKTSAKKAFVIQENRKT